MLKIFNKQKFSNIENATDEALKCLLNVQEQIHLEPDMRDLYSQEVEVRRKYNELNQARSSFLQQKVKQDWINSGDMNTRYFHACLKREECRINYVELRILRGFGRKIEEALKLLLFTIIRLCLELRCRLRLM